jgi:hypothetical protein
VWVSFFAFFEPGQNPFSGTFCAAHHLSIHTRLNDYTQLIFHQAGNQYLRHAFDLQPAHLEAAPRLEVSLLFQTASISPSIWAAPA